MFFLFDSASNVARVTGHDFDIFRFIPGYSQHIVGDGKEPVLLLLLAFLITFALTRLYTRLARVYGWGSGSVGGVHLHHMVVGILIMIATALVAVAQWPNGVGRDLIAIFFGIGAALILDEFALSAVPGGRVLVTGRADFGRRHDHGRHAGRAPHGRHLPLRCRRRALLADLSPSPSSS